MDSPLEGERFEPSVPQKLGYGFETGFVPWDGPHSAEGTHAVKKMYPVPLSVPY
jgi:hypothetical protein